MAFQLLLFCFLLYLGQVINISHTDILSFQNATFVHEYSALALESRCLFDSDKQIVSAYYPKIGLSKSHGVSLASYNRIWFFGFW